MNPWLLALLFLLALAALASLVRAVTAMVRGARLCTVPLRPSQWIDFPAAGRVVLCMEGPRFTPQFRKLRFELRQPDGVEVSGHRILFRLVSSGISRARVTLRTCDLSMAGPYELVIHGLQPQYVDAPEHSVVFMRPHLGRTVAFVIGITLASALAIVSLVFFLLSVVPTAAAIDPGRSTGYVQLDESRIELREAFAHLHRGTSDDPARVAELRIVLADREIPQESLAGPDAGRVLELDNAGTVRGILIRLDPDDPGNVTLTVLTTPPDGPNTLVTRRYPTAGRDILRNLRVTPQRVSGDLACPSGTDLGCTAHFSAPLFTD
jgi:hypothetical protein